MSKLDTTQPHERLAHARREAGFSTASEAARAFGWNENTYRSHENGERGIKQVVASDYARAFKTTAGFILFGHEGEFWRSGVWIAGSINAGGKIDMKGNKIDKKTSYVAQTMIMFNDDVAGFEVSEGANLLAFQPGDLLVVWAFGWKNSKAADNYAAVELPNGEWMLRMLRVGDTKNLFHLEFPFQPTTTNVEPKTILPVHAIVPRSQWEKLPPHKVQPSSEPPRR